MSWDEVTRQAIGSFVKKTLTPTEAEDQDILDYITLIGVRKLNNNQTDDKTRNDLAEIIKDEKVVDSFVAFFNTIKPPVKELEKIPPPPVETEKEPERNVEMSGKAIVNKSTSDIPAIYKEEEASRTKFKKDHREGRDGKQTKESRDTRDNRDTREHKQPYKRKDSDQQRQTAGNRHKKDEKGSIFNRLGGGDSEEIVKRPNKKPKTDNPEGEEEQKPIVLKPDLEGKSKCKFFPFCTNEKCEFFHPTEKCPYFPKCRFNDSCLFVHEACKFGDKCTRGNCFYDHPFKNRKDSNNNSLMKMMQMIVNQAKGPARQAKKPRPSKQPEGTEGN